MHPLRGRARARGARAWLFGWAAVFAVLFAGGVQAGHTGSEGVLVGSPLIERFTPNLDVYPQNYCVAQDSAGRLLVCGNDGVLEFDGERWRLTRMPNGEHTRSIAIAGDGLAYVGGYSQFGILRRNAAGILAYEDLTGHFRDAIGSSDIAEVYDVRIAPEGVYFRALNDVFLWDPQARKGAHWKHEGRFGPMGSLDGKTAMQFRGEGIKVREGAGWKLLPETRRFAQLLQLWLPLADGHVLVIDAQSRWWRVSPEGNLSPLRVPGGIPTAIPLSRGLLVDDGSIALASGSGDVYFVDAAMRGAHRVLVGAGFITGLATDRSGGVLASLQGSVVRIGWPAAWTSVGSEHGAGGNYYSLVDWAGVPYLQTTAGIFRAEATPGGMRFVRLRGFSESPYHLLPIDGRRALVAESRQLAIVEDGAVRPYSQDLIYPREFVPSRFHPGRVFLATDIGLRVIDLRGNTIKVSAASPAGPAPSINSIVETSATEVWAGTDRSGTMRFTLDASGQIESSRAYGAAAGLDMGQIAESYVSDLQDGRWVAGTRKGVFRWTGERFVADAMGNLGSLRQPEESFMFVATANGDIWAYSNTRLFHRVGPGDWRQQDIRPLLRGALVNHKLLDNNQIAFVMSSGVLVRHAVAAPKKAERPVLLLTAASLERDGKSDPLPLGSAAPLQFEKGNFSLRFEFALPELVREGMKRYQVQLAGADMAMSEWGAQSHVTYSSLAPGRYALKVRAADSEGRISELQPYAFEVVSPWHARPWAIALVAVASLLLASLLAMQFTRYRTRLLEEDKLRLEGKVAERTRELADANQRLEMMAHMDGLTGVANRRSLDQYLPAVWAQCRDQQRPVSVLVVDVDHFKRYNDEHGHLAGDEALRGITRLLMHGLRRAEDFLARFGGEEFVIVLPGADAAIAAGVAEALRKGIAESDLSVTVSIGVCTAIPNGGSAEQLIARADNALYEAKRSGRNCVRACEEPAPAAPAAS